MSFTILRSTQVEFLEKHLRGTGRSLSAAQANATYGVKNLRARMTDMRHAGLVVRREKNSQGRSNYFISRRDVTGSEAMRFN